MQCKDIPDEPILLFLVKHGGGIGCPLWRALEAMPNNVPEKLARAKMGQLIKRDLVHGCVCGCRGDFTLTAKGQTFISIQKSDH